MFGFSSGEILLIALIALVLFGNEKLPLNIKKFFNGWQQSKKVMTDLQHSWHEIKLDLKNDVEFLNEKHLFLEDKDSAQNTRLSGHVVPRAAAYTVSQEEIDAYEPHAEHDEGNPEVTALKNTDLKEKITPK